MLQIITPLQERGDIKTLAHPEGPYMQIHSRIRRELNPSGEFGERIEDAALHNPLPHLSLSRQKPIKHLHSESYNKSEHSGTRKEAKNRLESPER